MITHKTCSKCNLSLSVENFYIKNSKLGTLHSACKICHGLYYTSNKKEVLVKRKEYYVTHKEEAKQYYEENRDNIIVKRRKRDSVKRRNDPCFNIRKLISTVIGRALKNNSGSKNNLSCFKHVPYTVEELKKYLEQQFEPWMTWNNHGKYNAKIWDDNDPATWTWQIDHIIPQADLPYASMEDDNFQKCWALSNLRPYSAKLNTIEGANRVRHGSA